MRTTPQQTIPALPGELVAAGTGWGAQAAAYVDGKLVAARAFGPAV